MANNTLNIKDFISKYKIYKKLYYKTVKKQNIIFHAYIGMLRSTKLKL